MKRIIGMAIFLLTILVAINVFAAPPSEHYQLTFADEFDGESVNTDIWAFRTNTKTGGVNKAENVRVENGMLYIDYKKEGDVYTSGGIISKISFPYGYYETRAKVFGGTGALHTSFWIHGFSESDGRSEDIPKSANTVEVDAFEINSHTPTKLSYGTYYNWATGDSRYRESYEVQDWSEDYFVIGFEWLPDRVNFYVDGVLIGTDEDFGVYGPSHMWLTALAQPEKREHLIDDSLLPGFSEFDYYRFYQMPIKGLNLIGNGGFEYDRMNKTKYPRCYVIKGTDGAVRSISSYDAYEGYQCMIHGSEDAYEGFAGHKYTCIVPGEYTFSGMFKGGANLTKARMVVYGRNNEVIAEKPIPATTEWTKVSIEDIEVDGFAYIAIETASEGGTSLLIDNLEFYIQDGVEYTGTTKPDYEEYNYTSSDAINNLYGKYVKGYENATNVVGDWIKSSLKSDSYFAYYDENNSLEWETTAQETTEYTLEVYRQAHSGNMVSQLYTVYVNDEVRAEYDVPTKNIEEGWYEAGSLNLTKGDKVRIKLSNGGRSGFIRFYQLCLVDSRIKDMHYTPTLMIDDPRFYYQGKVYFENSDGERISAYTENGEIYLPYKIINEVVNLKLEKEEGTDYISATEFEELTDYDVIFDKNYIYLNNTGEELDEYALSLLYYDLQGMTDVTKSQWAQYVGTETDVAESIYDINNALKSGTWSSSSVGGGNYYAGSAHKALWHDTVAEKGRYKIQFNTVVHDNSNPKTSLEVFTKTDKRQFFINQKSGVAGWYDLGTYELDAGEAFTVVMGSPVGGNIRIKELRLIALPDGVSANQNGKDVNVTVSRFPASTVGKIILAEYKPDGTFVKAHIKDASQSSQFTLESIDNFYKIMLWKGFETMSPLCDVIEKNSQL